jgi:hypothetical protein
LEFAVLADGEAGYLPNERRLISARLAQSSRGAELCDALSQPTALNHLRFSQLLASRIQSCQSFFVRLDFNTLGQYIANIPTRQSRTITIELNG